MSMMEECLALAQKAADENEVPVGAVIVQDGKIVGRGYNRRETEQNPISHAEIEAILEASRALGSWRLERCVLYVTLEPCPMCLAACQQARVERVVYGAKDPKGGALSLGYKLNEDARTNHRFAVDFEETPACGKILSEFFSKKRNRIAP
jgi:tRNA(adenine34) deaminase